MTVFVVYSPYVPSENSILSIFCKLKAPGRGDLSPGDSALPVSALETRRFDAAHVGQRRQTLQVLYPDLGQEGLP